MTDTATGQPAAEVEVEAAQDQQQQARTETCVDGSYRLRVAPGATRYVVQVSPWSNPGYAAQAWNNTAAGTAFLCEGTPITLTNPGDTRGSINFSIEEEAVIEGHFYTQASGCGETLPDNLWVGIDDGEQHDCNLGAADDSAPGALTASA